ncbi:MAG: CRISPR-associated endonuclease Cas2 [Patescibacteria group bacterium]
MTNGRKEKSNAATFKSGELKEYVLSAIGLTCVIGGSLLFPSLPIIFGSILGIIQESQGVSPSKQKVKRVLKNFEKQKLIYIQEKNNEAVVYLTDRGRQKIVKYSLASLLELKRRRKQWNHKWFMVFFDVPESERIKRDYLRKFLIQIGFFPYQQSVYIFPYACEQEIALIKKMIEGGKYLSYVIAEKIEYENEMRTRFKLN